MGVQVFTTTGGTEVTVWGVPFSEYEIGDVIETDVLWSRDCRVPIEEFVKEEKEERELKDYIRTELDKRPRLILSPNDHEEDGELLLLRLHLKVTGSVFASGE